MAIVVLKGGKPTVYVHDTNLGQDGRAGHPSRSKDQVDVVTFLDDAHRNRPGLENVTFDWTGIFTATSGRSYNVIKDMFGDSTGNATARVVSWYAGDTDPAAGVGAGVGMNAARVFDMNEDGGPGDLLELNASMVQDGTSDDLRLIEISSATASFTSTNLDMGASSTAGARFYLHLLTNSASGGNTQWVFTVQHASSTAASWVTATGATATYASGTTLGAVITSTGQLRKFVRVLGTRDADSGTVEYVIGAHRV